VTTLVLEYVLANAAVARSFSAYFAALIGKDPGFFTFPYKDYTVDFMAAAVIILCCLLLCFSTAGGSWFNIVVTGSQLLVILIILIAGFVKANPANLSPFLPYGVKGAHTQAGGHSIVLRLFEVVRVCRTVAVIHNMCNIARSEPIQEHPRCSSIGWLLATCCCRVQLSVGKLVC
jgi:amino acid transporter